MDNLKKIPADLVIEMQNNFPEEAMKGWENIGSIKIFDSHLLSAKQWHHLKICIRTQSDMVITFKNIQEGRATRRRNDKDGN